MKMKNCWHKQIVDDQTALTKFITTSSIFIVPQRQQRLFEFQIYWQKRNVLTLSEYVIGGQWEGEEE